MVMLERAIKQIEEDRKATKFYLIPYDNLSPRERRLHIQATLAWGIKRASELFGTSPSGLTARPVLTNADLGLNAPDQEDWRLPATVLGTIVNYVNADLVAGKALVIYGVGSEEAAPAVAEVRFQQGVGGTALFGRYQIEELYASLTPKAFFSIPAFYAFGFRTRVLIQLAPRATVAAGNRLHLYGSIIEAKGNFVA